MIGIENLYILVILHHNGIILKHGQSFFLPNCRIFFHVFKKLEPGAKQICGINILNVFHLATRVDPLTSILAVLARSCQFLTTSWQPWIPRFIDSLDPCIPRFIPTRFLLRSYQDNTYSKIVSYHDEQNSKIIKNYTFGTGSRGSI